MNIDKAIQELAINNITVLVELADSYGEDRDSALKYYVCLLNMAAEMGAILLK